MAKYFSLVGLGWCPARRHLPLFLTFASSIWVHCRCISWLVIKQMTAPRCCRRRCATPTHTAHPLPLPPLLRTPPTSLQFGGIAGLLKLLSLPVSRWVFGFISPLTCVCLHYWLLAGRLLFAAPLKPSICMYVPLSSCFSQASPSLLLMMRNLSLIFLGILFYVLFFASHHVPAETCLYHFRVLGSYTGKNKENP